MSADVVFRLPDLGEGLTESELVEWQVAVGDTVTLNQVIAEVETAKAMVELPSPVAGTVSALHADQGDVVQVGEPLVTFAEDGGAEDGAADTETAQDGAASARPTANLVGYGAQPARAGRPQRRRRAPVEPPAPSSGGGEPVRGVRRHTAAAMVASVAIPQATVHLTCDVTGTLALADHLRAHPRTASERVGVLAFVARAVCALAPQHPALLTRWVESDDGPHLEHVPHVDLGIAVATERGLVVPHVRAADALSLVGLARALADLTATARAGRSTPESLRPGTLTVTNVGVFGVDAGTPLLNPGETAILGLGQVARRPWEHDGEVALRHVVTLSLTFDHRVVDGEQGARFLAELGALLTDPGLAVLLGGTDGPGTDVGPDAPAAAEAS